MKAPPLSRIRDLPRTRLPAILAGLALAAVFPRLAAGDLDPAALSGVREAMQGFVDQKEVAGAVTVIGTRDGIASLEAVGSRDLLKAEPMGKDALFRIASMTKPITAIAIMILAEEGKLSIQDPVEKILPEFRGQRLVASRSPDGLVLKKPARAVTVRDLLTHTSGIPGGLPEGLSDLYLKRNRTLAEGVVGFSQEPLEFEPGSRWAYCNPGIDTLGRIIEVRSGKPYEAFLLERIFKPLGMADTSFYPTGEALGRLAVTYDRKEGQLVPAADTLLGPPAGARYPIPAGGLYSTAADLAKLYRMMLGGGGLGATRILKPESVEEMTRDQLGELSAGFVPGMGFGYGWGVVRAPGGVTESLSPGSYGHGGAFGTQVWIDPRRGYFVVLLIQRTGLPNADGSEMRRRLQAVAASAFRERSA
jgi:CubicO group peptidase (beta-lactamase class C family)